MNIIEQQDRALDNDPVHGPVRRFYREHLHPVAIEKKLRAAMTRAGVSAELSVTGAQDRTDSYADYDGVTVVCEDAAIRERATKWVVNYLAKPVSHYRKIGKCQAAVYREDPTTGVILFRRWSLGD